MDFGVGELNPTKCTQKVIEESSMRRISKETVGLWISVAKGTHTCGETILPESEQVVCIRTSIVL